MSNPAINTTYPTHVRGQRASQVRPVLCDNIPPSQCSLKPINEEHAMKKLLIVEDDQNISQSLAIRLKNAGYEVDVAPDALSGLEFAMRKPPDLVLLDISLPAGNGFGVAERLQSLLSTATPFIFLTAS